MNINRRYRLLSRGKSPSKEAMKRTYNRALLNGGITVDFSANIENIREISRKLGYNVLSDATFVYVPSSYGESKNFSQNPTLRNLVKYSEEFDNAAWTKGGGTITPNAIANPIDGLVTADLYTEDSISSQKLINSSSILLKPNTNYIYSIYLKYNGRQTVLINASDGLVGKTRTFDILNGVIIGSSTDCSIISVAGGWYKCTITRLMGSTVGGGLLSMNNSTYVGNGTSGFYMYAAHVEEGIISTTYQRTTDAISDFTFTRATSSTTTNKLGVIEDSCYNLLQRSEEVDNAAWGKFQSTITPNTTTAPNGTVTADKLVEDVSNNRHFTRQNTIGNGGSYTFSIFLKAAERSFVRFWEDVNTGKQCYFDLTNGTANNSSMDSTNITSYPNGWYLCSATINSVTGNFGFAVNISTNGVTTSYTGDGVSGIYIWGAMLNAGSTPRPYLRTTNRLNVPCLDYSSQARRNLLNYSEEFDNAAWTKGNTSIVANAINDINGSLTADKLNETATTGIHSASQSVTISSAGTYTVSVYVKAAERTFFRIADAAVTFGAIFNLSSGSVVSNAGASVISSDIVSKADGWFLASATFSSTTGSKGYFFETMPNGSTISHLGVAGSGVYICGAQLESGSMVTPYQKTTTLVSPTKDEPSLAIEPQSTNLVLWSEDFDNAVWLKGNSTATVNTNLSPFGTNKSYYLNDSNALGVAHFLEQTNSITTALPYTASFYVKKATDTWCQFALGITAFSANVWKNFNFDTGLFGNGGATGTWTAKSLVNGWWMITVTSNSIATGVNVSVNIIATNNTDSATRGLAYTGTTRNFCDVSAIQFE